MPLLITIDPGLIVNLEHLSSARLLHPGDSPAGLPVDMKHMDLSTGRLTELVLVLEVSGRFYQVTGRSAESIFDFLSRSSAGV